MIGRVTIAALLLTALAFAWPAVRHLRETPPPPPPPVRLALAPPPGSELGSGDDPLDAAIAPDERTLVFVATTDGTPRLWRRAIDADRAEAIAGTDGAQLPAWKASGGVIAFFSGQSLKQVSLGDGVVRDLADALSPSGVAWLGDGSLLFAPDARGPIRRLQQGAIGMATMLRAGDRAHVFPVAVGRSTDFVYTAVREDGSRAARLVTGGTERELITTTGHVQLVGDLLLSTRDGVLFGQRYDAAVGSLVGRATPLASSVGVSPSGRSLFAASPRLLLTATSQVRARTITWLPLDGKLPVVAGEPGDYWQLRLSPDDRQIALTITAPLIRTLDIVVVPAEGSGAVQPVTRALAADSDPVWADGSGRLIFRSLQNGPPNLFTHDTHRADANDEPLLQSELEETPTDWRNGQVLFHAPDPRRGFDIWTFTAPGGAPRAIVKGAFNETDGRWSPDGQWIAFVADDSGLPDVYVVSSQGEARVRVSFAGGSRPRWARDGRALFFLRGSQIMRADVTTTAPVQFQTPRPVIDVPGIRDYDVAHHRDAIVALVPSRAIPSAPPAALLDWMSLVPAS